MVKLTADLIAESTQHVNPCRERELDLRGYKFNQIENLGATLDQFDRKCFDIFSKCRVATQCIVRNGCISIVKYDDE